MFTLVRNDLFTKAHRRNFLLVSTSKAVFFLTKLRHIMNPSVIHITFHNFILATQKLKNKFIASFNDIVLNIHMLNKLTYGSNYFLLLVVFYFSCLFFKCIFKRALLEAASNPFLGWCWVSVIIHKHGTWFHMHYIMNIRSQ